MAYRGYTDTLIQRTDTQNALSHYMAEYLTPTMTLYDVGCGAKPFASFLSGRVAQHIGIDIENTFYSRETIDIIGSAENLPVPDASAEAVLSSQVIEHLKNPLQALSEAARVLKPDGVLFLSYPFLYPLHAIPHDFYRLTEYTVRDALHERGLAITDFMVIGGFWYCMGFYANLYFRSLNRGPFRRIPLMNGIAWLLRQLFKGCHLLEGFIARLAGKNIAAIRAAWAVSYVIVAKKRPAK